MFCPTCGNALSKHLKYCNRCGANLATFAGSSLQALEKRLDDYLDGLFWLTIFALGFIIGGMILLKRFQFNDVLVLAYMVVSSLAFVTNFAINLREVQRLKRSRDELTTIGEGRNTELSLPPADLTSVASVTENTTRNLQEVPRDEVTLKTTSRIT
jgi:hypothetical protein